MNPKRKIWVGGIGSVIAALCCFTPILAITFGAVGLGVAVSYLDIVLLPLLGLFLLVLLVGLVQLTKHSRRRPTR